MWEPKNMDTVGVVFNVLVHGITLGMEVRNHPECHIFCMQGCVLCCIGSAVIELGI